MPGNETLDPPAHSLNHQSRCSLPGTERNCNASPFLRQLCQPHRCYCCVHLCWSAYHIPRLAWHKVVELDRRHDGLELALAKRQHLDDATLDIQHAAHVLQLAASLLPAHERLERCRIQHSPQQEQLFLTPDVRFTSSSALCRRAPPCEQADECDEEKYERRQVQASWPCVGSRRELPHSWFNIAECATWRLLDEISIPLDRRERLK